MKFLNYIFIIPATLGVMITQAHIFKIETWKSKDSNKQIILLSDYHVAQNQKNQVNDIQQRTLIDFLQKNNAALVVEDGLAHDPNSLRQSPLTYDRNKVYAPWYAQADKPMILGLASQCHDKHISVFNAECRFPGSMKIGVDIVLNNIKQYQDKLCVDIKSLASRYKEAITQMAAEIKKHVEQPAHALLQRLSTCTECVDTMPSVANAKTGAIEQAWNYMWGQFFGPYAELNSNEIAKDIVEGLEARMVDMRLVYGLALHHDNPCVVIAAGDAHIRRIKPALKSLGYEKVSGYARDEQLEKEDLNPEVEPDALDLQKMLSNLKLTFNPTHVMNSATQGIMVTIMIVIILILFAGACIGGLIIFALRRKTAGQA